MSAGSSNEDEPLIENNPDLAEHEFTGGWFHAYGQRYKWRLSRQSHDETKKRLLVVDDHRFHRLRKDGGAQLWNCHYNGKHEKCPVRATTVGLKLMAKVDTKNHTHLSGQQTRNQVPQMNETEPNQETSPVPQACSTPVTRLAKSDGDDRKSAQKRSAVNEGASTSRRSDENPSKILKKVLFVDDSPLSEERPKEVVEKSSPLPLSEDAKLLSELRGPACFKINRAIQLVSKKDEQLKNQSEEISKLQKLFENKAKESSMQSEKLESLTEETSRQRKELVQISEARSKLEGKLNQITKLCSAV
ncbi:hypothetical protein HDE_02426 [Halotydeus destructor]|nr:hypothetical protein HDE_02426 [Halotydeus destructor]